MDKVGRAKNAEMIEIWFESVESFEWGEELERPGPIVVECVIGRLYTFRPE